MIFNISLFDEKINMNGNYTQDTVRTYISCLNNINRNYSNSKVSSIEIKKILMRLKSPSNVKKYISAIRRYEEFCLDGECVLARSHAEKILNGLEETDDKGLIPKISRDTAMRKINALKNKKLKYALRIQIESGLRVFEISKLKKRDINIQDNVVKINVIEGKGRKDRTVNIVNSEYLCNKLKIFLSDKGDNEKLFYSRDYLRKQMSKYGINSHDLRRLQACHKMELYTRNNISKGEAIRLIKKELGHTSRKDTLKYLRAYFENT